MEAEIKRQLEVIKSRTVELISEEELAKKLADSLRYNRPLKIKLGVDPTAPDIHLGHCVVLQKLREFQDLGHVAFLIIGDYTARIGDPSGRSEARPLLKPEEIERNARTYVEQVFKILDEDKTRILFNSQWLEPLKLEDIILLSSKFTLARLLERDDFQKRFRSGLPISLLEFLYPIMQAYDSVAIEADVELGGTEQKFNLLVGRDLQREYSQEPQIILTMPLLVGTDGVNKMSKSLGNYIGVNEDPQEIFGKVMSIPDSAIIDYLELATDLNLQEILRLKKGMDEGSLNPGDVKRMLSRKIVERFYSEEKAQEAEEEFNRIFRDHELPSHIPELSLSSVIDLSDEKIWIIRLLRKAGFANTNSEARRLVEQGGVKIDGETISDVELELSQDQLKRSILQVGKRRFVRLI